ncbi:hypothetical protein JKP88DRAFT_260879 [Tribonema minus]|uniref:Protein regulator of cytokinesis 1 n=1 Tax=Tribonema minus TaxID=303371 RepID=A0A835ZH98_9STRA|nr:hypothetical protein JKP88DRAFT_260879 [Tribonema minus]
MPHESSDLPEYVVQQVIRCTLKTAATMETLWEEVGYNFEERVGFVDLLLQAVGRVCEERMEAELRLRNELTARIEHVGAEVARMARRAGAAVPAGGEARQQFLYGGSHFNVAAMTLTDRLAVLEVRCDELKKEEDRRRAAIQRWHAQIARDKENMADPLEPEWHDTESDLSDARLAAFEAKAQAVSAEKAARAQRIVALVLQCHTLFRELRWEPQLPLDYQIEELHELAALRRERQAAQLAQLRELWARLGTPQAERDAFEAALGADGIGEAGMERLERALRARRAEQRGALATLVADARAEAAAQLAALQASAQEAVPQNAQALSAPEGSWNETVLEGCMAARNALRDLAQRIAPLQQSIDKREAMLLEREEFFAQQQQQIDYSARGSGLTEQLQRVERMKRRIKEKLPRLTDALRRALAQWEQAEGFPVRYRGQRYLDLLERPVRAGAGRRRRRCGRGRGGVALPGAVHHHEHVRARARAAPPDGDGGSTASSASAASTAAAAAAAAAALPVPPQRAPPELPQRAREGSNPLAKALAAGGGGGGGGAADGARGSSSADTLPPPRNPLLKAAQAPPPLPVRANGDANPRPLSMQGLEELLARQPGLQSPPRSQVTAAAAAAAAAVPRPGGDRSGARR